LAEALDGGAVRLRDDLAQRVLRLLAGLAGDDEAVQAELRGAAGLRGGGEDAGDVLLVALEGAAVGEVPVGDAAGGGLSGGGVAAEEDLRVGAAGDVDGLGVQGELV